ncbi:MAG TPA: hypothetical protein VLK24_09755 [Gaiellaceae bacterium]|nr:hypothetical protein [Gaiellaceae bacterium]
MKRYLLLLAASIAALAVVLPATAGATTFRGAVVAKDTARKALVTASKDGTVRTVRLHTNFNRFRVGSMVAVRGSKLPDGTYSAAAVRRVGKARGTHVRGTVVRQLAGRLVMSAGGSVFALRLAGKKGASDGTGLQPGDRVDCDVHFKGGNPETRNEDVDKVGHDGQLVLEGIYLSTDEQGTIELAVIHKGRVFVNVPGDVQAPDFQAGDEVALVVTVEDDGSFTLVRGESENKPGDGDDDGKVDIGKEQFSVPGVLSAIGADGLSVKVQERPEPVRCTFKPGSVDLSGFEVGQWVYVTCKYTEGRFVLVAIKHKDAPPPPPGDGPIGVHGTIVSLGSDQVGVEVDGHEDPVSCDVPAGMDLLGFVEGDVVKMYCVPNEDGGYTLKALISDHASVSPEGSWFIVHGTIHDLNSTQISVDVAGRDDPVACPVAAGADLSAFHVGDAVAMKCKLIGDGFKLKLLESATAHYELIG